MEVTFDSEFMKNQKHADVMRPDKAFEVLQTTDGDSLFFSIGTDDIFYVTREIRDHSTGWNRVDLSSSLASFHTAGAKIVSKHMAVAQNTINQLIDAVLVVTVDGNDFLYYAIGLSNTVDSWGTPVQWKPAIYDDPDRARPILSIGDLQLVNLATTSTTSKPQPTCIVDVIRAAADPMQLVDRYYIDFGNKQMWQWRPLAVDLKAGSVQNFLGHRKGDRFPGVYTFGTISDESEMIYAPERDAFSNLPPPSARLSLPDGTTTVTTSNDTLGNTNVFIAAATGIYLFGPSNQRDLAQPILIKSLDDAIQKTTLTGVISLSARTIFNKTVLWGVNAQRDLFTLSCPAGSEMNPGSWSIPLVQKSAVEAFAFYLNKQAGNNVLFAHLSGQDMIRLVENPVTATYSQGPILLPPTKVDDIHEYDSYSTRITVKDENGAPVPDTHVSVRSAAPATVFINNVYYVLGPAIAVNVKTDHMGTITILQETSEFHAGSYQVQVIGTNLPQLLVDPMSNAMAKLSGIKSGDDLANAKQQTDDGVGKPLLDGDIDKDTRNAAASTIGQLLDVKSKMPADGSTQTKTLRLKSDVNTAAEASVPQQVWGVSFTNGKMQFHQGDDAFQKTGTKHSATQNRVVNLETGVGFSFSDLGGALVSALKGLLDDIESFTVSVVDDVYYFAATIAGKVYNAILDCVAQVVGVLEFVFNKIKLFIEEIIAWLGFLFAWKDIMRTQKVIKNILKCSARYFIDEIGTAKEKVDAAFTNFEGAVSSWAGLPSDSTTIASQQKQAASVPGMDSPQSHWGIYHAHNNASSADIGSNMPSSGSTDDPVTEMENLALAQLDNIGKMASQIEDDVAAKIASLSAVDAVKRVLGIVTNTALRSTQNILDVFLDLLKSMGNSLLDVLETPVDIPVISWIYKLITGDDLSFLDLIALVVAIPGTIIYKIVVGRAQFPNNDYTNSLIDAGSLSEIGRIATSQTKLQAPALASSNKNDIAELTNTQESTNVIRASLPSSEANSLAGLLNIVTFFGGWLTIGFNFSQSGDIPASTTATNLKKFSSVSYLFYCASSLTSAWDPNLTSTDPATNWIPMTNLCVTGISVLKSVFDNYGLITKPIWTNTITYLLDFVINSLWLVPAAVSYNQLGTHTSESDSAGLAANICFDVSGIIAVVRPWLKATGQEEADVFVFELQQLCNTGCTFASIVAAGMFWKKIDVTNG